MNWCYRPVVAQRYLDVVRTIGRWWQYYLLWLGSVVRYCDVGQHGMVEWTSVILGCVRSQLDIWMIHRSMRNKWRVADEVYLKRGCWCSRIPFFSLCTLSLIQQSKYHFETALTSCHVMTLWIKIANHLVLIMISHCAYQKRLCTTAPGTLERVF